MVVMFLSAALSGCASSSIPAEKQKDYSLLVPAVEGGHPDIIQVDQQTFHRSLLGTSRDVLPGNHMVVLETCYDNQANLLEPKCVRTSYQMETKPGLAYVFKYKNAVWVYDRFDMSKTIDTLTYSQPDNAFVSKAVKNEENKEALTKLHEDVAATQAKDSADQAKLMEIRKNNLPHVRKIGARICKNENGTTSVGFVEALAEEKVQIRITESHSQNDQFLKPSSFTPSIIWDDPMNWDLCEK